MLMSPRHVTLIFNVTLFFLGQCQGVFSILTRIISILLMQSYLRPGTWQLRRLSLLNVLTATLTMSHLHSSQPHSSVPNCQQDALLLLLLKGKPFLWSGVGGARWGESTSPLTTCLYQWLPTLHKHKNYLRASKMWLAESDLSHGIKAEHMRIIMSNNLKSNVQKTKSNQKKLFQRHIVVKFGFWLYFQNNLYNIILIFACFM